MDSHRQRQDWQALCERFAAGCADGGLDLVQPFRAAWYNAAVDQALRLPDFERPDALALLVGNSRRLWDPFVAALRARPALRASSHPIDDYVASVVQGAAAAIEPRWSVRWANRVGPGMVAMQRAAAIAGLAWLSPSYLSVHPQFGPWIGLRAVVVVDVPGPAEPAPAMPPVCDACESACLPVLSAATRDSDAAGDWRRWLAVRDACPVGRPFRYDDDQIRYHYTKDRTVLDSIPTSPATSEEI